ncbi:enamine deaminase RidA (YjgF/YER057c/UK114 family) [Bradyrhizobium sp. LB1.3]
MADVRGNDRRRFVGQFSTFIFNALPSLIRAVQFVLGSTAKSLATTVTLKCAICRPSHSNIGLIMIKRVLPYEGLLHEAVEHNGVLYIGGIVPEDTSLDMSGQANDVLGQLAQLLKTLGSDLTNVLQVTIYMTSLKEKAEFNAAWKAHFAEAHLPARAAIRRGRSRSGRQTRDHGHRRSTIVAHQGPNSDDLSCARRSISRSGARASAGRFRNSIRPS